MTDDLHAHVAAGPAETPRPVRHQDAVLDRAARLGFETYCAEVREQVPFLAFKAGLQTAYDYLLSYDRRGR